MLGVSVAVVVLEVVLEVVLVSSLATTVVQPVVSLVVLTGSETEPELTVVWSTTSVQAELGTEDAEVAGKSTTMLEAVSGGNSMFEEIR